MCDERFARRAEAEWNKNKEDILKAVEDLHGNKVDESLRFLMKIVYMTGYTDSAIDITKTIRNILA